MFSNVFECYWGENLIKAVKTQGTVLLRHLCKTQSYALILDTILHWNNRYCPERKTKQYNKNKISKNDKVLLDVNKGFRF